MATEVRPGSTSLEPRLAGLLSALRSRIVSYIWTDGLALIAILLGTCFWISLVLDWGFELPWVARLVILFGVALAVLYLAMRFLFDRLQVGLADRNMAVLLERRFGQFRDGLLTSVELTLSPDHAVDFSPEMLDYTRRDAISKAATVNIEDVFNKQELMRRVGIAVALAASVGLFALLQPAAMGVWVRRDLLLSSERWPRKTHLTIEGLKDGHIKIARGTDWALSVKADANTGRVVPDVVEVRYNTVDGARGRETMSQDGGIVPGEEPYQQFSHTFRSVLSTITFYVKGGDAMEGPYYLDAVDSPTIAAMKLQCAYPEYTELDERTIPVAGLMQLPQGTFVTIVAQSNKELVSVSIEDVSDDNAPEYTDLDLVEIEGAPQKEFTIELPRLDADQTLLFRLHDTDNIKSRDPVRLALRSVPDEAPSVNIKLKGIGTAITPKAQLPAVGEITDDYGLTEVWFDFRVDDEEEPGQITIDVPLEDENERASKKVPVNTVMDVRDLDLEPKQKLHWSVQASDTFALGDYYNIGVGERYTIDIVSAEELRAMLEARELMLRQKFAVILDEQKETRAYLATINDATINDATINNGTDKPAAVKPAAPAAAPQAPAPVMIPGLPPVVPPDVPPPAANREPTPDAGEAPKLSKEVQVERVLQNSQRAAHETLQVAIAFDEIREEMDNNRIDDEEFKRRLKDDVSGRLKRIAGQMFPKLETDLKDFSSKLNDAEAAPSAQAAAIIQMDAILKEMDLALSSMLALETFNELLDNLRGLIESQEEVHQRTKELQKKKLDDLLD